MGQQGRILLVEDEASHVRLVVESFRLSDSDLLLDVASSIADARQQLNENDFDLVLADYLLHDGQGSDLIPEAAESAAYCVVLLTSHGDERIAVEAMKSGAVDYVVKSAESFPALPRICERALEHRQLQRDRREAELALRRSEQQLRLALQASRSAAWEFNPSTGRTLWSPDAIRLTGLTVTEGTLTDDYLKCVHSDDRTDVESAWQKLLAPNGTTSDPVRVEHRLADGDREGRWIELSGRVIEPDNGPPYDLAGMLTDITARKQAEEALRQKESELAHVARLGTLGELVAGIAHELNQPLAAIRNYASATRQMLSGSNGNSESDHDRILSWQESITEASDLAGGIIRRLRGLVDRRAGRKSPTSLHDLVQSTLMLLRHEERLHGVTVSVEWSAADMEIEVDPIEIQQVLINLLRNAYIALQEVTDGQRWVKILAVDTGSTLTVSISDTGPGVPEESAVRVFDSFFTTRESGLGMGLAICRSIIERHGGRIRLKEQQGPGACFEFDLPRRNGHVG